MIFQEQFSFPRFHLFSYCHLGAADGVIHSSCHQDLEDLLKTLWTFPALETSLALGVSLGRGLAKAARSGWSRGHSSPTSPPQGIMEKGAQQVSFVFHRRTG